MMQALSQEVTHVFGGPLSRFCMRVILRSQPHPSILQAAFPSENDMMSPQHSVVPPKAPSSRLRSVFMLS